MDYIPWPPAAAEPTADAYHRLVKALAPPLPSPSPSLFCIHSAKEHIKLNDICSREMSPPSSFTLCLCMDGFGACLWYQRHHLRKHGCRMNFVTLMQNTFHAIMLGRSLDRYSFGSERDAPFSLLLL